MNPDQIAVFVRITLYTVTGLMARGDWLPPDIAEAVGRDPALIEVITTGIVGLGVLTWYWWSKARRALDR